MQYTLNITVEQAQMIVKALATLPLNEVLATYQNVVGQLQAQERALNATTSDGVAQHVAGGANGGTHVEATQ